MKSTTKSTRATQQTTRINGARVVIKTSANGKVTVAPAAIEEWVLQAAAVRALRAMPEYAASVDAHGKFTLAGDFNAARRSMREQVKAKATGLAAGEHDLRCYMAGGRMGLIEFKAAKTPVSKDQRERHALLAALGFTLQAVIRATTEEEAAAAAVATVRGWIAENDSGQIPDGWELRPKKCGGCGAPSTEDCRRHQSKACFREFHDEGTRKKYAEAA